MARRIGRTGTPAFDTDGAGCFGLGVNDMTDTDGTPERTARCGCGSLTVTTRGETLEVYVCSCLNCQRESGGAFTYSAVYPETAVSIAGAHKTWRRVVESGRWLESGLCPTCGVTVFSRMEAWPEVVGVSVGCFADPDFPKPEKAYWASRHHRWLSFPDDTDVVDTQPL